MANKTSQTKSICPWKKDFPHILNRATFIVNVIVPIIRKRFGEGAEESLEVNATVTLTPNIVIVGIWGFHCVSTYEYIAEHNDFHKVYDAKQIQV